MGHAAAALRDAATIVLRLARESGQASKVMAMAGSYQQMLSGRSYQLMQVRVAPELRVIPEASAEQVHAVGALHGAGRRLASARGGRGRALPAHALQPVSPVRSDCRTAFGFTDTTAGGFAWPRAFKAAPKALIFVTRSNCTDLPDRMPTVVKCPTCRKRTSAGHLKAGFAHSARALQADGSRRAGPPRSTRSAGPIRKRRRTRRLTGTTTRIDRYGTARRAAPEREWPQPRRFLSRLLFLRREPFQHWNGGRQQRRHVGGQRLPDKRLTFAAMRLARPLRHLAEKEPHVGVRIVVFERMPEVTSLHVDAEFLVQLARERRLDRFPRLQLAARKLPVAFVRLAGRTLGEQNSARPAARARRRQPL